MFGRTDFEIKTVMFFNRGIDIVQKGIDTQNDIFIFCTLCMTDCCGKSIKNSFIRDAFLKTNCGSDFITGAILAIYKVQISVNLFANNFSHRAPTVNFSSFKIFPL